MGPIIEFTFTIPAGPGGFTDTSYQDMIQKRVTFPGLAPRYHHTLISVTIADDKRTAQLTVASEADHAMSLDAALRPVDGTPPARVKAFDHTGKLLHTGSHPAPLQPGARYRLGDTVYTVATTEHPGRNPRTGMTTGDIDWQHVVLMPVLPAPLVLTPAGNVTATATTIVVN